MKILTQPIKKTDLADSQNIHDACFVKAVVDIQRELVAIDAPLHADLEQLLLNHDSDQYDLWGINLYLDADEADFIEYDSMINIRPAQGNRSRGVENPETQQKIKDVIAKWVK